MSAAIDERVSVLSGWRAYFRTCRGIVPGNIATLLALAGTCVQNSESDLGVDLLHRYRSLLENSAEAQYRAGRILQEAGKPSAALLSYAKASELDPAHEPARTAAQQVGETGGNIFSAIERLQRIVHMNPSFGPAYRELSQKLGEAGQWGAAREAFQKALELEPEADDSTQEDATPVNPPQDLPQELRLSEAQVALFCSYFRGHSQRFARQWVDEKGRQGFRLVESELTQADFQRHLLGEDTLAIYVIDEKNQTRLAVLDLDISNRNLLEAGGDAAGREDLRSHIWNDARKIEAAVRSFGMEVLIEDSGYKGCHFWFFFSKPISPKLARRVLKLICETAGSPPECMRREMFPASDTLRPGSLGSLIKLPLGIHRRSGRRCLWTNSQGEPVPDQGKVLEEIRRIEPQALEKVLLGRSTPEGVRESPENPLVRKLLEGCVIIRALVDKSTRTHYLNHFERLSLLYTLGHLGPEGKAYLHRVIGRTINYDYDVTESYIRKMKENPVSCPKLRERHSDLAQSASCVCPRPGPQDGYPSPVLFAFGKARSSQVRRHSARPQAPRHTAAPHPLRPQNLRRQMSTRS